MPYNPVGPKRLLIVLGVFIMSLGAGIGLAFFLEYLDDTIKSVEDVERYAQLPMLGIIPAIVASSSRFFKKKVKTRKSDLSEDGSHLGLTVGQNAVQSKLLTNIDVHSMAGEAYRALQNIASAFGRRNAAEDDTGNERSSPAKANQRPPSTLPFRSLSSELKC